MTPSLRRVASGATSPTSQVLWVTTTSCPPSRPASFSFAFRYRSCARFISCPLSRLPRPRAGLRAWFFCIPHTRAALLRRRRQDLSCSQVILFLMRPVLRPRRDLPIRLYDGSARLRVLTRPKLPAILVWFRGSITRHLRSLSTLHTSGRPRMSQEDSVSPLLFLTFATTPSLARTVCKTRFRLPAKLYRMGLVTHWITPEGFKLFSLLSSFSEFS